MKAALAIAGLTAAAGVLWGRSLNGRRASQEELRRFAPREGRPGGYISSDKCRTCHPREHDSWSRTYHRTMTQYATPRAISAPFDGLTLDSVDTLGEPIKLERRGDEFWVEMIDPDWLRQFEKRDIRASALFAYQKPRVWKRVTMTTGSHHMQAYWVPSRDGNGQYSLPFTYLYEEKRWVPRRDVFLVEPDSPWPQQVWNTSCILCHATAGQPRLKEGDQLDTRVGELGISCEACHGPGREHAKANQNILRRYVFHLSKARQGDPTIVNPARLTASRSSQVCGHCHGIKCLEFSPELGRDGYTYRPGDDMEATAPLLRPRQLTSKPCKDIEGDAQFLPSRYWPDGIVRVSGREYGAMIESRCNQGGRLSCLSCHSMHTSEPDDQLATGKNGNEACLQCHDRFRRDLTAHTHHAAGSPGSECYNCHMPYTTYGLLKAIRSHYIDSPSADVTVRAGRPNACNLCHLDQSLGWTAKHLSQWYGTPTPQLSSDERTISAAVLGVLRGDAGLRALYADAMGREAAKQASGQSWMAPFLATLLVDRYAAVRYVSQRSLRRMLGFESIAYDYVGPVQQRQLVRDRIRASWTRSAPPDHVGPRVLLDARGALIESEFDRLLRGRDDHAMFLGE